jgi:mannitol 2-dehydrogenase
MKLRLLNCSHKVLAYLPRLAGFRYVHDAAGDPDLRRLTRAFMDDEVTSTVPPVPGEDLEAYKTTLIERFSNPNVRDTVDRLCLGGSQQIPKWFPPMIAERLGAGQGVRLMAAVIAAWARYCEGVDDAGQPIPFFDTAAEELTAAALRGRDDPLAFLRQRQYFGDLVDEPRFTQPYLRTLDLLHTRGATETIRELVGY